MKSHCVLITLIYALSLLLWSCTDEGVIATYGHAETVDMEFMACAYRTFNGGTATNYVLGMGGQANCLTYAVYDDSGNIVASSIEEPVDADYGNAPKYWAFTRRLPSNAKYTVFMWADHYGYGHPDNPYTVDLEGQRVTVDYAKSLLPYNCAHDYSDAFYCVASLSIDAGGRPSRTFYELHRPFCQINAVSYSLDFTPDGTFPDARFLLVPASSGAVAMPTVLDFSGCNARAEDWGNVTFDGATGLDEATQSGAQHGYKMFVTGLYGIANYVYSAYILAPQSTEDNMVDGYTLTMALDGRVPVKMDVGLEDVQGRFGANRMIFVDVDAIAAKESSE